LTAERLPASQALTLGLVDELVPSPDLVEAAARRAARLGIRIQDSKFRVLSF